MTQNLFKAIGMGAALIVLCSLPIHADIREILTRADEMHERSDYEAEKALLTSSLSKASTSYQLSELYWRISRVTLDIGDDKKRAGAKPAEVLPIFEEGETYADRSIANNPRNPEGYFWKSANIGLWAQARGIFESLAKAEPMRKLLHQALLNDPDHADSFYILGQLYEQLPGWPFSFGNPDYAVSLGRKSLDLHEQDIRTGRKKIKYDYYTEMARHLWARNWPAVRRTNEQKKKGQSYRGKSDPLEKHLYYEGALSLSNQSDRDEARQLLRRVARRLEAISNRSVTQKKDLLEIRDLAKTWFLKL